jgi:hypothetical protein
MLAAMKIATCAGAPGLPTAASHGRSALKRIGNDLFLSMAFLRPKMRVARQRMRSHHNRFSDRAEEKYICFDFEALPFFSDEIPPFRPGLARLR